MEETGNGGENNKRRKMMSQTSIKLHLNLQLGSINLSVKRETYLY